MDDQFFNDDVCIFWFNSSTRCSTSTYKLLERDDLSLILNTKLIINTRAKIIVI